jgi:hypothetical protein
MFRIIHDEVETAKDGCPLRNEVRSGLNVSLGLPDNSERNVADGAMAFKEDGV